MANRWSRAIDVIFLIKVNQKGLEKVFAQRSVEALGRIEVKSRNHSQENWALIYAFNLLKTRIQRREAQAWKQFDCCWRRVLSGIEHLPRSAIRLKNKLDQEWRTRLKWISEGRGKELIWTSMRKTGLCLSHWKQANSSWNRSTNPKHQEKNAEKMKWGIMRKAA